MNVIKNYAKYTSLVYNDQIFLMYWFSALAYCGHYGEPKEDKKHLMWFKADMRKGWTKWKIKGTTQP